MPVKKPALRLPNLRKKGQVKDIPPAPLYEPQNENMDELGLTQPQPEMVDNPMYEPQEVETPPEPTIQAPQPQPQPQVEEKVDSAQNEEFDEGEFLKEAKRLRDAFFGKLQEQYRNVQRIQYDLDLVVKDINELSLILGEMFGGLTDEKEEEKKQ